MNEPKLRHFKCKLTNNLTGSNPSVIRSLSSPSGKIARLINVFNPEKCKMKLLINLAQDDQVGVT